MTHNQISWQQHLENVRHNLAQEQQTQWFNATSLGEIARSNRAKETETNRYNTLSTTEQNRTNVANESIRSETNAINAIHYANQDANAFRQTSEAIRHNKQSERIQGYDAQTKQQDMLNRADYNSRMATTAEQQSVREFAKMPLYNAQTTQASANAKSAIASESLTRSKVIEQNRNNALIVPRYFNETLSTAGEFFKDTSQGANNLINAASKVPLPTKAIPFNPFSSIMSGKR